MSYAILIAIGADRPGLVDEVSEFIFERGGNIEDSRMVNLRGQFAMMVLVGGDEATIRRLGQEVVRLAEQSRLHVELRPAELDRPAVAAAIPYRLTASAIDQPGLVHRISHSLRDLSVNIESMETRLTPAPITGAPLFAMELVLSVPRQTSIANLRRALAGICDEQNIDWQLAAMSP